MIEHNKCHDCGVDEGMTHVYNCDMERCPFCGGQLLSCECCYTKLNIDCSEGSYAYENGLTEEQLDKWIEILTKKGRVPYIIYPNMCGRCGELWPEMFKVSDDEWEKYVQFDARKKMLCKNCYDGIKRLIDKNV